MKSENQLIIPFNKPHKCGKELLYMEDAFKSGHISGNGKYTRQCHDFFVRHFGFRKCLMTTSCTDALEMSAILTDVKEGDEVIVPAFTFVSSANAFALRGANLVFADSGDHHPNMDVGSLEALITPKTKAIVPVHYAGTACDMDALLDLAVKYRLYIIEDAAQAINAYYKKNDREYLPLGSMGHLAAMSFHETKNISSGEGGMLMVNDARFDERSEIIWEKGTNRSAYFRGEINKYGWVDVGSSFLPSDLISAFLYAQLEKINDIQFRRQQLWKLYDSLLRNCVEEFGLQVPQIPGYAIHNAHIYYLVCKNSEQRELIIKTLRQTGIHAVFHYQNLHTSAYFSSRRDARILKNAERYSNCLLRLPLYYDLDYSDIAIICQIIIQTLKSDAKQGAV